MSCFYNNKDDECGVGAKIKVQLTINEIATYWILWEVVCDKVINEGRHNT